MRTRIVRYITIAIVAAALIGGGVWLYQTRSAAQSTTDTTSFTQTVAVQQGDIDASISVVGALDAAQQQTLAFDRMDGTAALLSLEIQVGNTVEAGQVLGAIDSTPYQQALDQAESALQEAQQALADLQEPATASDIAQADLAVAQAKLDLERAQSNLADIQAAPDLSDVQAAVEDAQSNLALATLEQTLADHDSAAASQRDLQYAVEYHQRLIGQLQDLVAQGKASVEQTEQLTGEQETLAEVQAELAQVQALRRLALQAAAAEVTATEAALADAQEALADAQNGDTLDLAQANLAVQQANVTLQAAQEARADLATGVGAVELAAAQADVDKKQLAVSEAEADLAAATLTAPPWAGTVLQVNAEVGDRITAGSEILSIANLDELQVVASVDETTIRQVSAGQPASISFDAFPGQTFTGQVLSVPLQGTLQGGIMVYEVPISLVGADELPLLVGMTANVDIQTGQAENALLVPTMALQTINGLYQVLVPNSDPEGDPISVPVEVGLSNGTYTQIVRGLNPGDQVVVQLSASDSTGTLRGLGGSGNALRMFTGAR
ncbi:MAG TPA: efflux RND transporter periplasmic adaptor subunit [Anaerolineae bacterium]|nr:efflux RND transporter periplasmic adaptor subunit [Anaerolineae bacterium]